VRVVGVVFSCEVCVGADVTVQYECGGGTVGDGQKDLLVPADDGDMAGILLIRITVLLVLLVSTERFEASLGMDSQCHSA
jgi:hypothetical protein